MIKLRPLKQGSKVSVISPSSGSPYAYPGLFNLGLKNLKHFFGFDVVAFPTARLSSKDLYNNPQLRAKDINDAFADDSIDAIFCSIGGYDSVRILEFLDIDLILSNPKAIMGFSDATSFLTYLNLHGLPTFYGPSVMAGIAQLDYLTDEHFEHIKDILFDGKAPYTYLPYDQYTNGYHDWANQETLGHLKSMHTNIGHVFTLGEKTVQGQLWGGCIEVLEMLKGTKYWPTPEFFDGKILFFETSEDKPTPIEVGYMLRNYGTQGILNRVTGVLFGRPKDYTGQEKLDMTEIVLDILKIDYPNTDIPVVFNVDFGHTDPKHILPLGCTLQINPKEKRLTLLDSPFK